MFHEEIHGVRKIMDVDQRTVIVEDTQGIKFHAYSLPTIHYNLYMTTVTHALANFVARSHYIIPVSGARASTLATRRHVLDFADGYVLENGGVILDAAGTEDRAWQSYIGTQISALKEAEAYLTSKGWVLDIEGRTASLRVREDDNKNRTDEFRELHRNLELPTGVKCTGNLGGIDIIPEKAGKGQAIDYLLDHQRFRGLATSGIGDDINDIPLLHRVTTPYVLGSSYQGLISMASSEGWFVSRGLHFDGIHEILAKILMKFT
jgi:hypothetical protein